MDLDRVLFPHENVRDVQKDLIENVENCLVNKKDLIVHAPTGLGKTASTLPVALAHAIKNNLTVFFLTSRHTQHKIAIDTLRLVKEKFNLDFVTIDIIGKKHMCPVPGIKLMRSSDFSEYCKSQIEDKACEFHNNTKDRGKPSDKAEHVLDNIKELMPCHIEDVMHECNSNNLCPYEVTIMLSEKAKVIVADYYYIFNPRIKDLFFARAGLTIDKCIIIVDEGHNLPSRLRELQTSKLTTIMLERGIKEAIKYDYNETVTYLQMLKQILQEMAFQPEQLITSKDFMDRIQKTIDFHQLIADLEFIGTAIREKQPSSYVASIAHFLDSWLGPDKGFARILNKESEYLSLNYRSLNPLPLSESVIQDAYSTILMSGTLTPTSMYQELLGFPKDTLQLHFPSPFPKENKLALVIPETTTKFTSRNEEMYKKISQKIVEITDIVPGNCAVFFPSYYLRDRVNQYFLTSSKKTVFSEKQEMSKPEKYQLLNRFKMYHKSGAVLLGVSSGNFAEGIDLPGDFLKCVVVVGLPLQKPDLETKELIQHYDDLFGKGWDYGYLFPAFSKCLQSAGRVIRTETDKGVIVFLDERFAWNQYFRCFPNTYNIRVIKSYYAEMIERFFKETPK